MAYIGPIYVSDPLPGCKHNPVPGTGYRVPEREARAIQISRRSFPSLGHYWRGEPRTAWRAEFTKLKAWQVACDVADEIYTLTDTFPRREIFGLTAQMRSAAVSMSTNIAEGYGRRHPRDKARFYEICRSSGEELKSLMCLSLRLGHLEISRFDAAMTRLDHACRLAHGLVEAASSWTP